MSGSVSINSIDAVIKILDDLLVDFVAKLRNAHPRWSEDKHGWPLPPIIDDYDSMVISLKRLFEARHVVAHELPKQSTFGANEVEVIAAAAVSFIDATDWIVVEALHGAVPRTQATMNADAFALLKDAETELTEAFEKVASLDGMCRTTIDTLQADWSKWADAHASLVASQVDGGSMYPMLFASEKLSLTRERAAQLKRVAAEWLDP